MAICFVIQPFDSDKFDKRFYDVFKPAIEAAGFDAYRVDKDARVSVPVEAIEEGIRTADICLADITLDNPNVWYELGFAIALGRPVIMVCSEDRTGKKFPFDIQHRTIIQYHSDAPSDFDKLRESITKAITARIRNVELYRTIAEADPVAKVEGLSQSEILVLAVLAGNMFLPDGAVGVLVCKRNAEQAGLTNLAFNLAVRRLVTKKYAEIRTLVDEHEYVEYDAIGISELGWSWIESNETLLVLQKSDEQESENPPF